MMHNHLIDSFQAFSLPGLVLLHKGLHDNL